MLNFLLTFLLLEITAKLTKKRVVGVRFVFSSAIGAAYSLIIFCDGMNEAVSALLKIASSLAIVAVAFSFHRLTQYIKSVLIFYFSSIIILGVTAAVCFVFKLGFVAVNNSVLYFDLSAGVIIVCALSAYLLSCIVIGIYDRVLSKKEIYTLKIEYKGNSVTLLAFLDSGNNLREPFSNSPVIVVDKSKINFEIESFRYVPVKSVNGNGLLTAFKPDKMILKSSKGEEVIENAYVALSDNIENESYSALLSYNILSV